MSGRISRMVSALASDVGRSVASLLKHDPDGWHRSKYHLAHERAGIRLWVANSAYGLYLEIDNPNGPPCDGPSLHLTYFDRKLIWFYAKRFKWVDPTPGVLLKRVEDAMP